jgi:hypothetical protein
MTLKNLLRALIRIQTVKPPLRPRGAMTLEELRMRTHKNITLIPLNRDVSYTTD